MNCNYNYHSGVQFFKELLLFIPQTEIIYTTISIVHLKRCNVQQKEYYIYTWL